MQRRKGHQSLRKGRYSESRRAYHIVLSTKNRLPVFNNFHLARSFIQLIREDEKRNNTQTLAYVVMPDHIHWLLALKNSSLDESVKRIKSLFSHKTQLNIWNPNFYDHGIRDDEDLKKVARYIVANPLRAGLVNGIGDYPHWDAVWLK